MKRKKKLGKNGGFYIALCSCAAVVALVSYVGDLIGRDDKKPENVALENFDAKADDEDLFFEISQNKDEPGVVRLEPEEEVEIPEPAEAVSAIEEVEEFLPSLPVPGKVITEFSGDNLVKYERLGDWRTHSGIDIAANVGDDVYICENGVVEKIYSNNFGGCILVDHKNGYKSLYANLGEIDLVNEGDDLRTGETIGRVGEPSVGDITAEPHVHFEMYYEGKAINPLDLVDKE